MRNRTLIGHIILVLVLLSVKGVQAQQGGLPARVEALEAAVIALQSELAILQAEVDAKSTVKVDKDVLLVAVQNVGSDTGWIPVDLSGPLTGTPDATAVYLEIESRVAGTGCEGDAVLVEVRPFGDSSNIRKQRPIQVSETNPVINANEGRDIDYFWLPIDLSQFIEYRVTDVECGTVENVTITLKGTVQ